MMFTKEIAHVDRTAAKPHRLDDFPDRDALPGKARALRDELLSLKHERAATLERALPEGTLPGPLVPGDVKAAFGSSNRSLRGTSIVPVDWKYPPALRLMAWRPSPVFYCAPLPEGYSQCAPIAASGCGAVSGTLLLQSKRCLQTPDGRAGWCPPDC